jgi:signal transduction histidine kinase
MLDGSEAILLHVSQNVKLPIAVAVLFLAAGAAAYGQPAASAAASEPAASGSLTRPAGGLLFVGNRDNEPFSFLNREGKPAGFDVDVLRAACEKLGIPVNVELLPAAQALAAAREGRADGVVGMGLLPDQPDPRSQWKLCGPTVPRIYRIFISRDNDWLGPHATPRNLAGTRVAVLADDPVVAFLGNERALGLESVRRSRDGCTYVINRHFTAFIADENVIRYGARQGSMTEGRFVGAPIYEIRQWGPAIALPADANGLPSGNAAAAEALAKKIQTAIAAMDGPGGQLESLRKQWFAHKLGLRYFWQESGFTTVLLAAGVAAVLVVGVYGWRRGLLVAVERRTRRLHTEAEGLRRQVVDLRARLEHVPHAMAMPVGEELDPAEGDSEAAEAFDPPATSSQGPTVVSVAGPRLNSETRAEARAGATPLELNELIRGSVKELEEAVGPEIRLHVALGQNLPPVLGQSERLRQLLLQLCANSRDAIHARRRTERGFPERVWVATRPQNPNEKPPNGAYASRKYVALSVRDTGCGIEPALVQKIFQAGYTTKSGAAGKGLTFVYEVVAQHGGWIDVESAAGRGATFSVYLPTAEM